MKRKAGKNLELPCRVEELQSRVLLSADAELGGDEEVVADDSAVEILVLDDSGESEVKTDELEGELEGPDVIFYTMGDIEDEVWVDGEESPVVGEGVDGEVIITMLPEGSDGEELPDEALPAETVWLTNTQECSGAPRTSSQLWSGIFDPIDSPTPGREEVSEDARWAPPEDEELPDDFVPPDDTIGEEEEPADDDELDLAIIAPDELPDGSAFGDDVSIEDDILGTEQDILA